MLKEILSIQSTSENQWRMFAYIIRHLSVLDDTNYYVDDGNIYITKGDAREYPCVVAHMDTVHDIVEDLTPIEIDGKITGFNRVTMEQTGIGGDDKVGIYIALKCLEIFDNIKVAFFRDEEIGCVGSYGADMDFFKDCMYVLQCDRKGNSDFIVNGAGVELSSDEFIKAVEPLLFGYGYSTAFGSITDVVALKENGLGVSVANISCGYYNPHMAEEYVVIRDVENCLALVVSIIATLDKRYVHDVPVYEQPKYWSGSYGKDFWYDKSYMEQDLCNDCWADPVYEQGMCKTCHSFYYPSVSKDTHKKSKWLW